MRNNPLGVLLAGGLTLSTLLACWSSWMWFAGARQVQVLEFNYQRMNTVTVAMQALAAEAVEYSKRNPSIDPILIEHNVKPRPVTPIAPPAAPKTPARP